MNGLIKNLIQIGIVSSVDKSKCTAKVAFESRNTVRELSIIVRGTIQPKDYWIPVPGEQVLCVFLPNGNDHGFILGSFYSEVDTPPEVM